jgi:5-methylcytosine-specific restriction endonuclease McrA
VRANLLHTHGSPTCYLYANHGCRCAPCRAAGAEYRTRRHAARPAANAESQRRYRAAHPEERSESQRRWRAAHPEERAEYARRWRATHSEEGAEYVRRYRAAHPAAISAGGRNRRAREYNARGTHTAADIRAQFKRQKGRCFWGRKVDPDCAVSLKDGYHVDHVIPLALGGSNGPENLVLACPSCNLKKYAKDPMDFAGVML